MYSVTEGDTKGRAARASMVRAGRAEHEGDTDLGAKPELKCRCQKMCQGGHATEPAAWPKNTRERKPESADQRTHCARDLEAHTRQQERQCASMPSRRLPQLLQSISIRVSRANTHKSLEYPLISALGRSPSPSETPVLNYEVNPPLRRTSVARRLRGPRKPPACNMVQRDQHSAGTVRRPPLPREPAALSPAAAPFPALSPAHPPGSDRRRVNWVRRRSSPPGAVSAVKDFSRGLRK